MEQCSKKTFQFRYFPQLLHFTTLYICIEGLRRALKSQKEENIVVWKRPIRVINKNLFMLAILDKTFRVKQRNISKVSHTRKRKLWKLFLCKFWLLLQKIHFCQKNGAWRRRNFEHSALSALNAWHFPHLY